MVSGGKKKQYKKNAATFGVKSMATWYFTSIKSYNYELYLLDLSRCLCLLIATLVNSHG